MDPTGTETQLGAGAEVRGSLFGPISPALFLDVFLTEGVDHNHAVETIKRSILAVKETARREEQEMEQTKKRKRVSGEDREHKRPRVEGSRESTPPLTEPDMSPELVGGIPFPSRLSVAHFSDHKAQAPAIQLWDPRVCEPL